MIFVLVLVAFATILFFIHLHYQYWKRRGVPGPKPTYIIGNLAPCYLVKKSPSQLYHEIYNAYRNASVVGIFRSISPTLIIRDPELIKEVVVKSFSSFHNNDLYVDKKVDPLFGRNPFVLRDEEWKTTRQQLTPAFTSGKMKGVYPLLENVSEQFITFIANQPEAINGQGVEVKELCKRFTLNNVGTCAFGLDAKCFEEENSEFKQIADRMFSPEGWNTVKIFAVNLFPSLGSLLHVRFTPKDVEEKLTDIVTQTIKYREEHNVVRNDFLHGLHQLKKSSSNFTEVDITAHAAGFFGDGYETSSIVMSFILYELASNPDVQSKLRDEINTAFEENEGKLPYEALQGLSYLDAVFNESMRLHPALGILPKVCTQPYVHTPKDGDDVKKPFTIEKGTTVIIPLYGIQRDPKYFEEPNCFKPERFLSANKEKLTKYSFLPFGEGPRICLGQRFGSLQVKIGVAYVIKNYELSVNKKTKQPIEYDPLYFLTFAKGGLWLDFKKIA